MPTYKVIFTAHAKKSLKAIDKAQAKMIILWMEKNLENTSNPRQYGKSIKGSLADWRYRIGNYRILANINGDKINIEVVKIGHRKDIYSK